MSKKVVISGYYGFDNFGDDAILYVLCEKLKTLNAQITVLSANPQKTSEVYDVNAVKNFDIGKVIRTLSKSDVLISGGGSLLQDVTSVKSLFYYSFVILIALILKKDVIIFAQGIGPLNKNISQFLVKFLLRKVKFVSVRDERSLNLLRNWGIDAKLANDPVFSVKVAEVPKNFALGVQLRDFITMNDKFLESLAENVLAFFPNRKIELFVFQKSLDEAVSKKFINILKSQKSDVEVEIIYYENKNEIFKRISQLNYMIAMRFHAVIAAIMAGVRTSAINYDIKVEKLAQEASIPLISLKSDKNDYKKIFTQQKSLNSSKLSEFSASKQFDWCEIENLLLE